MWQMLNTIAGAICIPLLTYWVLEFRRARKKLDEFREVNEELQNRFENYIKHPAWEIEDCKKRIKEYSKITIALRENMGEVITKMDAISKAVEYWGTNPASLPLKEHKQLIKDVAQIKSELEAITVIVNRGMVKRGKKNTYLTKH